jgi:hypothetical protein
LEVLGGEGGEGGEGMREPEKTYPRFEEVWFGLLVVV